MLRREAYKDQWAAGAFSDMSQFGTAILNAKAIGICMMIEDTLGVDWQTVVGELGETYGL